MYLKWKGRWSVKVDAVLIAKRHEKLIPDNISIDTVMHFTSFQIGYEKVHQLRKNCILNKNKN